MLSVLNSTLLTLKQHVFSTKLEKPVQTHAFSLFEQTVSVYPVQTDCLTARRGRDAREGRGAR